MFSRSASRLRLGLEPRSRSLALARTCCLVQSSVRLSVRVVSYKWQVFAFRTTLQFHYYFVSLFSPSFSLFYQGPRCSVGSRNNRPNTYPSVGLFHRPGGGVVPLAPRSLAPPAIPHHRGSRLVLYSYARCQRVWFLTLFKSSEITYRS